MRVPRAGLAALLLALGLSFGTGLAVPRVALACSCVGPQPLAAYAGPETVIFAGEIVSDDPDGVFVGVEQWFSGDGAASMQLIEGDFGNGASCGIGLRPAVGSRWLVVAWRPPDGGPLPGRDLPVTPVSISICQPFVDLGTPEGAALLEEAVATFGGGAGIPGSPESPGASQGAGPAAPVTPAPTASATAADDGPSSETVALVAAVGTLAAGVGVLAVVLLVARRRTSGSGPAGG